ncbi:hypothetical protein GGD83_002311 [Rhodoblastus sphagnicola]|uniref:HNH endonuclease signature motif containing protein n=1 Tax=Rhodoblastus sphagnicola TaxID=333368 RepID=UPI0011B0A551|nr:HNH endonuclease signature motif containing protein [Rhodoblastus sphagnicola]MBB4198510.1 hypothetical protein [Rhodoblastus sphagnicola]
MRSKIPTDVARRLRKEAGFGCCVCGRPFIEYHHIVQWAGEQHYRPEDMMVLCPNHHAQVTAGAMPQHVQRQYKAAPLNIREGRVRGKLEVFQDYCAADLGGIIVVNEGPFLVMDGENVVSLNNIDNSLHISLRLYDESDNLILEIENNEWVSGDPLPWDIEARWQYLRIRDNSRKVSVCLNAKAQPLEFQGVFYKGGHVANISKDKISLRSNSDPPIRVSMQNFALVGLALEIKQDQVSLPATPYGGAIVSWPNKRERLWKAREYWRKLKRSSVSDGP